MKLPPPPVSLRVLLSHAKVVWKHWNVQSMVITSFIIQLFLIFFAPFRRKSSNRVLIASLWLAYLLADWVAIQSIGLISNPCGSLTGDNELYAFWAQFLLLHLGGPDTITALALEDNELWLRTGLHLAVQVYGGLGILVKSVGHSQTGLWLPTMLMFAAGIIKYMERVSSLFHGRLMNFSSQILVNRRVTEARQFSHEETRKRTAAELVRHALRFFDHFNDLYADKKFSEKGWIRDYMLKRTPEEAFRMLEIQFNLAYEAFYTKTALICRKTRWKTLRLAVTLLQVGCLVIWLFFTNKHGFEEYNILITYILLVGAVAVDVFAFLMIHMWSEWSIAVKFDDNNGAGRVSFFHKLVISARKRTWGGHTRREDAPFWTSFRRALFRQWSESIPQLSLLSVCLEEKSNKLAMDLQKFMGFEKGITQFKYVSRKWFSNDLRDFLHQDLKEKRKRRGGVDNIGKVKGGWACHCLMSKYETGMINIPTICQLLDINEDYFKILVRWHIITEVCYQGDHNDLLDDNFVAILSTGNESKNNNAYREICKTLSHYLMYLLIHRQDMLSPPSYANESLKVAYEAVKETIMKVVLDKRKSTRPYLACKALRDQLKSVESGDFNPVYVAHFPGGDILGELEELEKKQIDKWEFMAKVWSELLYYAAINCEQNLHATNLKQGGELLSFVWLLSVHLGFGDYKKDFSRPEKALLHISAIEDCKHSIKI